MALTEDGKGIDSLPMCGLAEALVQLGFANGSRTERERAARTVLERVGSWGRCYLRRMYARQLARLAPDEADELVAAAVAETVLAAIRSKFRGGSERGAHAWCKSVMSRHLLGQLRRDSFRPLRPWSSAQLAMGVEGPDEAPSNLSASALLRLVRLLEQEIRRGCRRRDVPSVLGSFELYIDSRAAVPDLGGGEPRVFQ